VLLLACAAGSGIGGATPTNRNGTNNRPLAKGIQRFDEAGRGYESQQEVFVAGTTTLPSSRTVTHTGGGLATNSTADDHTGTVTLVNAGTATGNQSYVLGRTVYDRAGRTVSVLADNTGQATMTYDGASRVLQETDPAGNTVAYVYDAASNVTLVTATEKCTITEPTVPSEVFRQAMRYDSLGRLVVQALQGADGSLSAETPCVSDCAALGESDTGSSTSNGETLMTLVGYDSRGNQTLVVDPKGNSVISVFDGASRPTQTQENLRSLGQGDEPASSNGTLLPFAQQTVTTTTVYDGNSRVRQVLDDNGNPTNYEYDSLNRQTKMIYRDGSSIDSVYNTASDVLRLFWGAAPTRTAASSTTPTTPRQGRAPGACRRIAGMRCQNRGPSRDSVSREELGSEPGED